MALIQSTATLLELMPGRDLHLGLGTSGRALVEKFHGIPFDRPVTRLSEVLGIVDTAFATGRLPGPGAVFSTESVALRLPASRASLKLFVAGLGGRTLQVAGSSADGWLPIWPSSRGFPQMLDTVRAAAAEAGRPRPLVAAYVYGVVSAEPRMVDRVRASLAWYVAANGTAYRRLFTDYGYGDEVAEICARWASGDRVGAAHGIPAEMLADCTLTGDTPAFLAGATRLRHLGIDVPVLRFPTRITADECVDMVTRLGGASR
ncbi:MAG: 5,10-methylenetetrahydromethanopterin reductase, partial [Blastococcus sp.]|nr:5,10-methylenetetrahydromethanopterin reductase [Blastococcus sp.]